MDRFHRWLDTLSTSFKTDMHYLVKGGFWLTISQVGTAVLNFVVAIFLAKYLTKNDLGTYRYILAIAAFVSSLSLTGIATAVVQSVASGFDGALRQGVRLSMRWGLLTAIAALGVSGYYFYKDNTLLGTAFIIVAAAMPIINSYGLFLSYLNGKKLFQSLSAYTIIDNAFPAIVVVTGLFFTKSPLVLVGLYFLSNAIVPILLYARVLAIYQPSLTATDPDLENYSKKLSLVNTVANAAAHVDKVIVFTSLGAVELAIYGIALTFPEQIKMIFRNLQSLIIPKLAGRHIPGQPGVPLHLSGKIIKFGILLLFATVAYYLIAPLLYAAFFPTYPEAVIYSQIFSLSLVAMTAIAPLSVIMAFKEERQFASITYITSFIQVAGAFIGVHWWGLMGAIVAKVITAYCIAIITFFMVQRRHPLGSGGVSTRTR